LLQEKKRDDGQGSPILPRNELRYTSPSKNSSMGAANKLQLANSITFYKHG